MEVGYKIFNFISFFFSEKKGNHCEGYANFQDLERQFQENILYHFLHYNLL